jgi:hypothetical protein
MPASNCMTTELVTVGPEDEVQARGGRLRADVANGSPAGYERERVVGLLSVRDLLRTARAAANWGTWRTSRGESRPRRQTEGLEECAPEGAFGGRDH